MCHKFAGFVKERGGSVVLVHDPQEAGQGVLGADLFRAAQGLDHSHHFVVETLDQLSCREKQVSSVRIESKHSSFGFVLHFVVYLNNKSFSRQPCTQERLVHLLHRTAVLHY